MIIKKFNCKNNEIDILIINIKFENLKQNMQDDYYNYIFFNT